MVPSIGEVVGLSPDSENVLYSPGNVEGLFLPVRKNFWEDFSKEEEADAVYAYSISALDFELLSDKILHAIMYWTGGNNDKLFALLVGAFQNPQIDKTALGENIEDFDIFRQLMGTKIAWDPETLEIFLSLFETEANFSFHFGDSKENKVFGGYPHWSVDNCHVLAKYLNPNMRIARSLRASYEKNLTVNEDVKVMVSLLALTYWNRIAGYWAGTCLCC